MVICLWTLQFSVLIVTGVFLYFAPKLVSSFFETDAIQQCICFQNVTSLPILQFNLCNTHTDDQFYQLRLPCITLSLCSNVIAFFYPKLFLYLIKQLICFYACPMVYLMSGVNWPPWAMDLLFYWFLKQWYEKGKINRIFSEWFHVKLRCRLLSDQPA